MIFLQSVLGIVGTAIALNFFVYGVKCFFIEKRELEQRGLLEYTMKPRLLGRTREDKRTVRRFFISLALAILYFLFVLLINNLVFDGDLIDQARVTATLVLPIV